jgi:hypothetical protein
MKTKILFTLIVMTGVVFGQYNPDNHVVTISSYEFKQNPDGTRKDWLERAEEYYTKMNRLDKNLISFKYLTHRWSGASKDILHLAEWKSIADADASQMGAADMRKKAWPNDEKRKEFFGAYRKYYTGKHTDVAVTELVASRVKRHKKNQNENTIVTMMEYYLKPISKVEGGSAAEREALRDEYFEKVINKNDKILSWMELRHYWSGSLGDGDTPIIVVTEYANIEDADNNSLSKEAIGKAWPDEDERKAWFEKSGKYSGWGHKDIGLHNNVTKLSKR